ncbi:radical SAM protein [Candidatus Woesearchaeota archaeon]|nr:radical SAM protein [Candidatus Woesearchaeota archaeon]
MTRNNVVKAFKIASANLVALSIKTTNKCNLNCVHCSPNSNIKEKHVTSTEYIKKVIKQFVDIGGTTLILGGGEPFTRPDLLEIINFADGLDLNINIETNGILVDQKIGGIRGKNITFIISLDGIRPETHDSFRRVKGAYAKTIKNIELLVKNNFKVRITTVLNRKNENEIKDIVNYCMKMNIEHRLLPIITDSGRGSIDEARELALSPQEVLHYLEKSYLPIYRKFILQGKNHMLMVDLPRAILPKDIETFSICAWGINMIGLNHNGDISLCHYVTDEEPFNLGRIDQKSLSELWFDSKIFKNIRKINKKTLKGVCSNCIYVERCRGLCRLSAFQKYHDIYAPYPICQDFFEKGLFPKNRMIDPEKDCYM